MTWNLLLVQALNGLQYGLLLFLLAAGLTLVLGIMNFVNLAHGSLYMLGAYLGAAVFAQTGSFLMRLRGCRARHLVDRSDRRANNACLLSMPAIISIRCLPPSA